MQKNRLSGSTVNSQVSFLLLFSNIIGWKWAAIQSFSCGDSSSILGGYIILDITCSFHESLGNLPENLQKLFCCKKLYHPPNETKKPAFYTMNTWKSLSILQRI